MIPQRNSTGRRLFVVLPMLALTLAAPAAAGTLFRAPFRSFDVLGPGTGSVALGDLNGDGALDLVVGSAGTTSIAVLLNLGDGTFGAPAFLQSMDYTRAIVTADLNADGYLDLAVAPVHGSAISVFLGVGDGTFRGRSDQATGMDPGSIAVGDTNRDGHLDLVVANTDSFYGRSISTLLGNGDGTFAPEVDSPMDGVSPSSVALADFNGDGLLDVVAGYQGGGTFVYVMLGLGGGRFGPIQGQNSGYSPSVVDAGDVNEDGRPDFIAGGGYSADVSIHYGRGAGTFDNRVSIPIPGAPVVHLVDVDHDGHLDILTPAAVMRGHGDGTFDAPIRFQTDRSPGAVALGDLDGDGRADLVTASPYPGTFSILEGHGDGTFGGPPQVPTVPHPYALAAGDVNHDGRLDIATASNSDRALTIHLGDGAGGFTGRNDIPGDFAPAEMEFADLNGDGSLDLVGVSSGTVSTLLGNGTGSFGQRRDFASGPGAVSLATGDFNRDGRPDVVTANQGTYRNVRPYDFIPDSTVSILFGAGDGTLTDRVDMVSGRGPYVVRVADVNRDGNEDLVVLNASAVSVAVLIGNGDGSFRPRREFAAGEYANSLALGDFDGDHAIDVVVANPYGEVTLLFGNGDGSLRFGSEITDAGSLQTIISGDWNGDGKIDLATTRESGNTIHLLMNHGDGTFASGDYLGTGTGPERVLVTDLDGDRKPDMVAANFYESSLSILLGIPSSAATVGVMPLPEVRLSLSALLPAPPGGPRRAVVGLPTSEPARLDVFDAAGRRLLDRRLEGLGPGSHSIELGESRAWKSGIYFARLVQGARSSRAKWYLVR